MTPTAPRYVGIDIGGTKTAAVVTDDHNAVLASVEIPSEQGNEGVLRTAERAIAALANELGCAATDFASVGVGVPGQVDSERGSVRYVYNLGVHSLELGKLLTERTGLPVTVDNDVTAAAIGAAQLLGLDGCVFYLNLGTGLAAGIVVDGRPLRGARGLAGEVGHLPIDPRGRQCPCGQRGCLETVASGSALKRYWPAGGEHPGRVLAAAAGLGEDAASEDVAREDAASPAASAESTRAAREALDLLIDGAASAIRVVGLTIAPDAIVIGGGLRGVGAPLIDGIRARLATWERESEFLAGFELSAHILVLPNGSPAATVGAALAPRV